MLGFWTKIRDVKDKHYIEHCFSFLDLAKNSSLREIKEAYTKLALKWHPDKDKTEEAREKIAELTKIYTHLIDFKEKEYLIKGFWLLTNNFLIEILFEDKKKKIFKFIPEFSCVFGGFVDKIDSDVCFPDFFTQKKQNVVHCICNEITNIEIRWDRMSFELIKYFENITSRWNKIKENMCFLEDLLPKKRKEFETSQQQLHKDLNNIFEVLYSLQSFKKKEGTEEQKSRARQRLQELWESDFSVLETEEQSVQMLLIVKKQETEEQWKLLILEHKKLHSVLTRFKECYNNQKYFVFVNLSLAEIAEKIALEALEYFHQQENCFAMQKFKEWEKASKEYRNFSYPSFERLLQNEKETFWTAKTDLEKKFTVLLSGETTHLTLFVFFAFGLFIIFSCCSAVILLVNIFLIFLKYFEDKTRKKIIMFLVAGRGGS